MLDTKIVDFAGRLIQVSIKKRQKLFCKELSRKGRELQLSNNSPETSSSGKKIIRDFFVQELEAIAHIVWESLLKTHKALGSQFTETLGSDFKEAVTLLLEENTKELLELMMKQPCFAKNDSEYSTFCSAMKDESEGINIEVDLYVDSLAQESAKEKAERSVRTMAARSSKENWEAIKSEYDVSKNNFGRRINFVSDEFKRKIIFRDVEHAFVLASQGFSKPALILAGGVIEELLKLYLKHKKIKPKGNNFIDYIKACEDKGLLKLGTSRLTDSIRDFRNLVHLDKEKTRINTITKPKAKGAVAAIFTIVNDFQ